MTTAIGIDPGARWTGMVLGNEHHVITGGTIGPRSAQGLLEPTRLEEVFATDQARFVARTRAYTRQIGDLIDQLIKIGQEHDDGARPLLGIELYEYPARKAAHVSWMVPTLIVMGLAARFDDARLVRPAAVGSPAAYPSALRGRHPEGWLVRDEPSNRRGHEQSAWRVAQTVLGAAGGPR